MTNGYDESIAGADGTILVGFGPRRFDASHARAVIDAETCGPEEAGFWGVYTLDKNGLPPHALGRPEYVAQRPDRAGARESAEQWAKILDQGRAQAYAYDTHILDASGNRKVSYGPRRLESDASDAHVEPCLPAEAAFWGVYTHDAEGLASIVADAHDQASAKSFAELASRHLDLEALLVSAVNTAPATPRIVLVMEGERIQSILADTPVEVTGLNYDDDEMDEAENNGLNVVKVPQGDGTVERAVIGAFPVEVNPVETARILALDAETEAAPRRVVLAIDTNTAAFKDLGYTWEVARLLREAGKQLQMAPDLDSVRLVDTNDNEVGWLYAADAHQDLESPGMIHLVVDAGEDQAFGTTEADRMALAKTFRLLGDQLDGVKDLSRRFTAFTVEVQEAPYERNSRITDVKVGHFHYTPALEPEAQPASREVAAPEI